MIVVPSFAQRDQRHKPVVAAVVVSCETAFAKNVRQRIYSKGAVIKDHGADEESPNQHLESGGTQSRCVFLKHGTQQESRCCQNLRVSGEWKSCFVSATR